MCPSVFELRQIIVGDLLTFKFGRCDGTAWFSVFYFTFAMLFAQAVITLRFVEVLVVLLNGPTVHRIYAVTGNNRLISACLSFITSVQFAFGTYLSIRFALRSCGSLSPLLE